MKKIISIVLAVSLIFTLALTATAVGSADLNSAISGDTSKDVKVTVTGLTASASPMYYVIVAWDSLDFTYDFGEGVKTWNPENHTEEYTSNSKWVIAEGQESINDGGGVKSEITVTNHSNAAVAYTAEFKDGVGTELAGITPAITGEDDKTLASGVGETFETAAKGTFAVEVTGTPTNKVAATTTIKQVNITITAG